MLAVEKMLQRMRDQPAAVRFADLEKACEAYFGKPRQPGSSHVVYKTPGPGDPRVNIQNAKARPYQVRQVMLAIEQMELLKQSGKDK